MAESKLTIKIQSEVSQALSGIESVNKKLESLDNASKTVGKDFEKLGAKASSVTAIYNTLKIAISAVVNVSSALVNAYSAQEKAETRLATTLKATQNAIGMSANELYELASSFQDVTTYGDEAIIEVEKLFVSSGKISRDAMPQAVEATLDMAAAMGEDLTSSAKRLAKALADPKSNLDSLKDANIQLSDAQKENIKKLQEQGDLYGAQQAVLKSVADSYGGIARSLADTDTGKLTQIKNVWGDIKEGLGQGLLDTISPALDTLYKALKRISDFINRMNKFSKMEDWARGFNEGKEEDVPYDDLTDQEVKLIMSTNTAAIRAKEYKRSYPNTTDDDVLNWMNKGVKKGEFTQREVEIYKGLISRYQMILEGKSTENPLVDNIPKTIPTGGTSGSSDDGEKPLTAEEFISSHSSMSVTAQIAEYQAAIDQIKNFLADNSISESTSKSLGEIKDALDAKIAALLEEPGTTDKVAEYIGKNKGLSKTAQLEELQGSLAEATGMRDGITDKQSSQYKALDEIVQALGKEIEELNEETGEAIPTAAELIDQYRSSSVTAQIEELEAEIESLEEASKNATEGEKEKLKEITDELNNQLSALEKLKSGGKSAIEKVSDFMQTYASEFSSMLSSIFSAMNSYYQNQIDEATAKIEDAEEQWEKTLSKLEEDQDQKKDSLAHLYDEGLISLKEYNESMEEMYKNKRELEEQAEEDEEELQNDKEKLEKKQFYADKANSLSQAIINGAVAITNIWAKSNPLTASILTAMVSASTAAQIATISASQYTGLAAGGIVTKPTYALLGEGGAKEAVLPLTETNMKRAGFSQSEGGVININISIGTSYSGEQLSRNVYEGIERAQRTGLLPKWRYA